MAVALGDAAGLGACREVGAARALEVVGVLAQAVGAGGLAGGESLDLELREQGAAKPEELIEVYRLKTAPLFRAAASIAAILADLVAGLRRNL